MGSSTLLDIIGSTIVGGILLVLVIQLGGQLSGMNYTYSNDLKVQTNLTTLVSLIETDFRKIGYCAIPLKFPDPTKALLLETKHSIKYIGDINNDGNLDTVYYYAGNTASASFTQNPRDMLLYRRINSAAPSAYNLGVTVFDFLYYDAIGDSLPLPIADPSTVYAIRISVLLESPDAYDTNYSNAYWRQLRLSARNLRNR